MQLFNRNLFTIKLTRLAVGNSIKIIQAPNHIGIEENEKADGLLRSWSAMNAIPLNCPRPCSSFKH